MKNELGKYLLDVSKLVLGGVVLSSVLEISANKLAVILIGTIAAIILLALGLIILKKKK
jgi:membrane protein DedA with SNARE-associated domain